jgi:hypothetical protein
MRVNGERGQASVEVVALLPLLLAAGLGVLSLLGAGAAAEAAGAGAEAGAIALVQGRDAEAAARAALGGWRRSETRIRVRGRRVSVQVIPHGLLPPLDRRLAATATADAGEAASP